MAPTGCLVLFATLALGAAPPEPAAVPKPQFSGAYFGRMPRAWVEIIAIDPAKRVLRVRTRKGEEREVPVRGDTELRVRDAWGDLEDYYPGESVMLFLYHDAAGAWVYPRAVQDEIQMMSLHNWWWTVEKLDVRAGTVALKRTEKENVFRETFRVGARTKVWKGSTPTGLDALRVGDDVLFQTRYEPGQDQRFAVELLDGKGLAAIKAEQLAKHQKRLAEHGWPAVVNDVDILTGAVLVGIQWSALEASAVRPGERVELVVPGEKTPRVSAPVSENRVEGVRRKLLLAADPASTSTLRVGDELRVFPARPRD